MSKAENLSYEPVLSRDFAARVLRAADMLASRRRRIRRVVASSAAVGAVAIAFVFGVPPLLAPKDPGSRAITFAVADSDTAASASAGPAEETDALSYLFPDAPALARFADRYSAATYGTDAADGARPAQDIAENDAAR